MARGTRSRTIYSYGVNKGLISKFERISADEDKAYNERNVVNKTIKMRA